jgi:ribosomal protection tetracycline resistance protein
LLQRTLNLGILAHVDAGKTTLTERLLFAAGVIDEIGSVDDGTTQTDSLALEQQRGITIKSAVVSFAIEDVTVNLIDTPGHPDFIAEVERVLSVLDGAVLVISAVEGVQAQTPLLMRALQRLGVPTLLFVNKVDRSGADDERVLQEIADRLTPAIVPMGSVRRIGTREAEFTASEDPSRLVGMLAERNDELLAAFVDSEDVPRGRLRDELAKQAKHALVHPVFFGSALRGAGVEALRSGIAELLPADEGDADGPASGRVFKIERGPAGERIAYVRMFSGILNVRDRIDDDQKVTALAVFEDGASVQRGEVRAREIAKVWGLNNVQIGDAIGVAPPGSSRGHFAPPTLETAVVPRDPPDRHALHQALTELAEQDPLIAVRHDEVRQEFFVSLYGEVQKEVLEATLASDYDLGVEFRETTPICVERPIGTGGAVERLREPPNPFLATVGLRVEPAPPGSGLEYVRDRVVHGLMPSAFFKAVEDTVRQTLQQGLYGWEVTDCTVTMTDAGYLGRHGHGRARFSKDLSSTGEDFRGLTPLVLMNALAEAGTVVCEPIHRFRLEFPADALAAVFSALGRLGATGESPELRGSWATVEGEIAAARMHELQRRLGSLTRGEGTVELSFDHYEPVGEAMPTRPRTDRNPLNRKEYLLQFTRDLRVG